MLSLKPDKDVNEEKIEIKADARSIPAFVVSPKKKLPNAPGVLWLHGGGYILGMIPSSFNHL